MTLRTRSQWEAPHNRAIHPFINAAGVCPSGEALTVRLHEDILTSEGKVVATAGIYEARRLLFGKGLDGVVIQAPDHWAGPGLEVNIPCHLWTLPDEPAHSYPPHSCWDYVANGVRGGLYCGCCSAVLGE
jgi:hypothetical protein